MENEANIQGLGHLRGHLRRVQRNRVQFSQLSSKFFNFNNIEKIGVVKRGISQSLPAIQLISELPNQRARKAQLTCPLDTNLVCLFIIFSSILTNRSSQFSLILQHTMIVSAEIQVRALCNGALILFFRFQVSQGQNGDNRKK